MGTAAKLQRHWAWQFGTTQDVLKTENVWFLKFQQSKHFNAFLSFGCGRIPRLLVHMHVLLWKVFMKDLDFTIYQYVCMCWCQLWMSVMQSLYIVIKIRHLPRSSSWAPWSTTSICFWSTRLVPILLGGLPSKSNGYRRLLCFGNHQDFWGPGSSLQSIFSRPRVQFAVHSHGLCMNFNTLHKISINFSSIATKLHHKDLNAVWFHWGLSMIKLV